MNGNLPFNPAHEAASHAGAALNRARTALGQLAADIWSERPTFILSFVILLTLGALLYSSIPPRYRASALVLIDSNQRNVVDPTSASPRNHSVDQAAIETAVKIIRSPHLLQAVIARLGLSRDPEFADSFNSTIEIVWRAPLDLLSAEHPDEPVDPAAGSPQSTASGSKDGGLEGQNLNAALSALEKHIVVAQDGRSQVVTVTATSINPVKAAAIANALANEYVAYRTAYDRAITRDGSQAVYSRLYELQERLHRSQVALTEFKAKNGLVEGVSELGIASPILPREIAMTEERLLQVQADRARLESKLSRLVGPGADPASSADVLASPIIQQLRIREADLVRQQATLSTKYGPQHPEMVAISAQLARLRNEIRLNTRQITESLKNDLEVTRFNEQSLKNRLGELKSKTADQAVLESKLSLLKQEVDSNSSLYDAYLQRFKASAEQERVERPGVEVISSAIVPPRPYFPRPALMVFGLLLGAASGSSLAALARVRLRRGFRSAVELGLTLSKPSVAVVPQLRRRDRRSVAIAHGINIRASDSGAHAEAIGNVRLLLADVKQHEAVLFTSAVPKEGKTLLAISVALQSARAGVRTLYVDCDLYKSANTWIDGIHNHQGLSECLTNGARWRDVIVRGGESGPDIIPHGRRYSDPTQLMSSAKLRSFIEQAKQEYDLVILDGPPVLATAGARFLATIADHVVFATHWSKTRRDLVCAAYNELKSANPSICGLALMNADMRRLRRAGYVGPGTYYGQYHDYHRPASVIDAG